MTKIPCAFPPRTRISASLFLTGQRVAKAEESGGGRGMEMLRRMTQLFRGVFFCPAFSAIHLIIISSSFPLPRPHAAVRFLSLLRKNWSSAKRNWRGRNPTIMLRRVTQLCCGTIDACGGPRVSAAAPVGALFVCHRHTAPPSTPGAVLPGKSRAARTIYLRGCYPGNMSFDA